MFGLFKKKKSLDQDAISLFVRMSSADATEAETDVLMEWAENDPDKLSDVETLSEIWEDAGSTQVDKSLFFEEDTSTLSKWLRSLRPSSEKGWYYPVSAVAAMVLVAFFSVALIDQYFQPSGPVLYSTARGISETVELEDGSDIHLNGMSRVEVAFSENERRINMFEGEAYYEVASNKDRPFIVSAAGVEIRALGTAFDIEACVGAVIVTVTEGTVSISHQGVIERYSAGNKIEIPRDGLGNSFKVTKLVVSDYEDAITWRSGVINFSGETLALALERINRQSLKPIILVDPSLSDIQIFGSFRQGNISSFLSAIEALYPVRTVESQSRIALYERSVKEGKLRAGDGNT